MHARNSSIQHLPARRQTTQQSAHRPFPGRYRARNATADVNSGVVSHSHLFQHKHEGSSGLCVVEPLPRRRRRSASLPSTKYCQCPMAPASQLKTDRPFTAGGDEAVSLRMGNMRAAAMNVRFMRTRCESCSTLRIALHSTHRQHRTLWLTQHNLRVFFFVHGLRAGRYETQQKTGRAEAPTAAQMQKVVDTVNDVIAKDQACFRLTMPRKDAEDTYASAM